MTRSEEDTSSSCENIASHGVQVCIEIKRMEILVRRLLFFLRYVWRQMGILRKSIGDLLPIAFGSKGLLDRYVEDCIRFVIFFEKRRSVMLLLYKHVEYDSLKVRMGQKNRNYATAFQQTKSSIIRKAVAIFKSSRWKNSMKIDYFTFALFCDRVPSRNTKM